MEDNTCWWEHESVLKFSSPSVILCSGPSQSGKTTLTKRILENAAGMFSIPPKKIIYCFSEYQKTFDVIKQNVTDIIFFQGLPTREHIEEWTEGTDHTLLICDDLMMPLSQSQEAVHLFSVLSHHRSVSIIYLAQSLYPPGKYSKTLSLQVHYYILFHNMRDMRQIITFGSQVFLENVNYFKSVYEKCTSKPYGYVLIDISPHTNSLYRLRTDIFPGETMRVFLPVGE